MGDPLYPSKQLSDKDLEYSRFIIKYGPIIKKSLIGFFIFINALLIMYGFGGIARHLIEMRSLNAALSGITSSSIDWNTLRPIVTKPGLSIERVQTVQNGVTTDFIGQIFNPNENRYAHSLSYRFIWDGGETEWRRSFILPNTTKHVVALGVEANNAQTAALEIQNIRWVSIFGDDVVNAVDLQTGIEVEGGTIETFGSTQGILPLSTVSFTVLNNTPFSYRTSGFIVLVSSGSVYTAVTYETLNSFEAFETRDVNARMFKRLNPGGQSVTIEPDIHFFDEDNILL